MPHLLQLALFAREFNDVIRFTRSPRVLPGLLFLVLAPSPAGEVVRAAIRSALPARQARL